MDANLDELETSLRDIEAVAAGRASAVKGLGEAIRGFVYCLSVEMRDWFSHRQGEMAAEVAVWEGSGLSEGNGGCAGVAGDAGSPDMHPILPRASPSSTSCQPNSSHPIPPLHAPSQPSPPEPGSLPIPGLRFTEQEIRSKQQLAAGGRGRLLWFLRASTWNALMRALHGSGGSRCLSSSCGLAQMCFKQDCCGLYSQGS